MNLDPEQILKSQISYYEEEFEAIDAKIDERARRAISLALIEKAFVRENRNDFRIYSEERQHIEAEISRLSGTRFNLKEMIRILKNLQSNMDATENREWINTYITRNILGNQVDLPK